MKKRIIICCDGTWNDLEMRYITNVGRLVQALLPEGRSGNKSIPQVVYYDDGVGADASGLQQLMQGGFGWGIDNLIYEAYRHVCMNYEDGDELCLFGFSRGAFTARSLAGMIERVGLVPRSELKHVPGALKAYRAKNTKKQDAFRKEANSRTIDIDLLGCWDTVGALGIPDKIPFLSIDEISKKRYLFHNTKLGSHIKRAIHAVAIDEHRKEFKATLMEKPAGAPAGQKLVQKWFPGDHGSVGGGTWEKRGLSNHCLKWMIEQAADLGIELGVNPGHLHDDAISDHSIFFHPSMSLVYSYYDRPMPEGSVKWDDIDQSARDRWAEDASYRPKYLKRRFSNKLDNLPGDHLREPPVDDVHLEVGESADIQVRALEKNNPAHVQVRQHEKYRVDVSRLQVWKDGNLDPCDVRGWNTIKEGAKAKLPYEGGETLDAGRVKLSFIKMGRGKRLVPDADWFELVYRIGDGEHKAIHFAKPAKETESYTKTFTASGNGELFFAANDLASRFDLVDKYDNNAGWVWIRLTRES